MIDAGLPAEEPAGSPVDLTPLIDIVFMLIVFLLLTANAASQAIRVDTPQAATGEASRPPGLVLEVPADPAAPLRLDGQEVPDEDALLAALRARLTEDADASLAIAASREASSQRLIGAIDLARKAGIPEVDLVTRDEP